MTKKQSRAVSHSTQRETQACLAAGLRKNWLLCIDLMTLLQQDRYPLKGKGYQGQLVVKDDGEACFVEDEPKGSPKRNPRIFDGRYITVTYCAEDGVFRLNFKQVNIGPGFDLNGYAIGVMNEICQALEGLVEE